MQVEVSLSCSCVFCEPVLQNLDDTGRSDCVQSERFCTALPKEVSESMNLAPGVTSWSFFGFNSRADHKDEHEND